LKHLSLRALDLAHDAIVWSQAAGHFEHVQENVLSCNCHGHAVCVALAHLQVEIETLGTVICKLDKTCANDVARENKTDSAHETLPEQAFGCVFSSASFEVVAVLPGSILITKAAL
jgi:hypothetical protein